MLKVTKVTDADGREWLVLHLEPSPEVAMAESEKLWVSRHERRTKSCPMLCQIEHEESRFGVDLADAV